MKNDKRAFIIVLDSFGVGELPDAADFECRRLEGVPHTQLTIRGLETISAATSPAIPGKLKSLVIE